MVTWSMEKIRIKSNKINSKTKIGLILDKSILTAKKEWLIKIETIQKNRGSLISTVEQAQS